VGSFSDRDALLCFDTDLRASNWDVKTAKHRLDETLKWRREFGIEDLSADKVEPEVRNMYNRYYLSYYLSV